MSVQLTAILDQSWQSGLTLTAEVFAAGGLVASIEMDEAGVTAAYYAAYDPPAAGVYQWRAVTDDGNTVWTGEFTVQSEGTGNGTAPTPGTRPGRGGRWFASTIPDRPVNPADLREHCRIDTAEASGISDAQLARFIDAATEYAETRMSASLMPRTIVATFQVGEDIDLPRGPLIAVVSVIDDLGDVDFHSVTIGKTFRVILDQGAMGTLTVTYTAGYAAPDNVTPALPADLQLAILMHAATLYENRESVAEKTLQPVPHSLEAFYVRKCRSVGIG